MRPFKSPVASAACRSLPVLLVFTVPTLSGPRQASIACEAPAAAVDSALRQVVATVNAGNSAGIKELVDSGWAKSALAGDRRTAMLTMLGRWHWESTRLSQVRSCGTGNSGYAIVSNEQTGELDSLMVAVVPDGGGIRFANVARGSSVPLAVADTASDEGRVAALRGLVQRMAAAGTFSGQVLLAHNGRILYHEAIGIADRSTGRRATTSDSYSMASTGKWITATAIMELVERGKLSLDDTLGKFLGQGERPAGAAGVPIKNILSHTDGMTRGSDTLSFRPGTRFSYVNYGYYLLGGVIEKVTGKPFAEHFASALFAPAGMTSTRRLQLSAVDPKLPPPYVVDFDSTGLRVTINPEVQTTPATGAGGLYTTALDLYRFAEAFRTGRLVSKATMLQMRTPRREFGASDYGYGVDLYRGHNIWGHSGAIPGAESELELYGDSGYVFVLLANSWSGETIRRRAGALIGTRPFE